MKSFWLEAFCLVVSWSLMFTVVLAGNKVCGDGLIKGDWVEFSEPVGQFFQVLETNCMAFTFYHQGIIIWQNTEYLLVVSVI